MAEFTSGGLFPTGLLGYQELFEESFRAALGSNLSLAPQTPQGQIIGVLALALTEAEEALIATARMLNLDFATGVQLDDLASNFGLVRRPATQSTVNVMLIGTAGVLIPVNTRVATTTGGAIFYLNSDVAITIPASGNVMAPFAAQQYGPVPARAGTLTSILDPLPGWSSATNVEDATLGAASETDASLRTRYRNQIARNSLSASNALLARVNAASGVVQSILQDNDTGASITVQDMVIPSHSIAVVVGGGTDAAVATAIENAKLGQGTAGNISVPDRNNVGSIMFSRVRNVPLLITVSTTVRAGFPSGGTTTIIQSVSDFIASLSISEALNITALYVPIYNTPNHLIDSITVIRKEGYVFDGTGTVDTLGNIQAITTGSITIQVDNTDITVTGIDLSAATSIDDAAALLQIALRADGGDLVAVNVRAVVSDSMYALYVPPQGDGTVLAITADPSGAVATAFGWATGNIRGTFSDVALTERLTVLPTDVLVTVV